MPESEKVLKIDGTRLKVHKRQFQENPIGLIWNNLSIKINVRDYNTE